MGITHLGLQRLTPNLSDGVVFPFPVENLGFWYKSDADVFEDSAATTPATNGNPWGYWGDQSGNGNHATQSTTSKKGTFFTNVINGLPALEGDTLDDIISTSPMGEINTIFVVASNQAIPPATTDTLFSQGVASNSYTLIQTAGSFMNYQSSPPPVSMIDFAVWGAAFKIVTIITSATDTKWYYNGLPLVSSTGASSPHAGIFSLFNYPGAPGGWNGRIVEAIGYFTDQVNGVVNLVGNYLGPRYSITWSDL